jgi:hypothetical protein
MAASLFAPRHGRFGSGSGASSSDSLLPEEVYLNLTPLLDVLSNLMFFLLATFGTSAVAVFSASVPVLSTASGPTSLAASAVVVQLRLGPGAASISCSAPDQPPEAFGACVHDLAFPPSKPDLEGLSRALREVKTAFVGATTLVVLAEPQLPYAQLVPLLDAARSLRLPDGQQLPLFDDLIMARAAPVEPEAPAAPAVFRDATP